MTQSSVGSGFLYRPDGYIITNAHVVSGANTKDPQAMQSRLMYVLSSLLKMAEETNHRRMTPAEEQFILEHIRLSNEVIIVYLNNGKADVGQVMAYNDATGINIGKDIAIIKINERGLPTVGLGDSDEVHVGEPIAVIGYPGLHPAGAILGRRHTQQSTMPTITNGHISAIKMDYKGSEIFQSDAMSTRGNSGGLAFGPDGKVIALATFGAQSSAGFNFYIPINVAMALVDKLKRPRESGPFNATWQAALNAMATHQWSKANALMEDVLKIMPHEPDAERLQVIAVQELQK